MEGLIEKLRRLNRKERYHLVGQALGNRDFRTSDAFRNAVGSATGLTIPADAFVAMDYHLNWIHAAILICGDPGQATFAHGIDVTTAGNQEDADLLIAFDEGPKTHLILVEAKAATGWTNKQMNSKARRLAGIFGESGTKIPEVQPHFVLASPRPPRQLALDGWPTWMKQDGSPSGTVRWLKLEMPSNFQQVIRCDAAGLTGKTGTRWKIVDVAASAAALEAAV